MTAANQNDAVRPIEAAGDALHVRRVFGEAYEHDGAFLVPVAKVIGGGGMGYGTGIPTGTGGDPEGGTGGGGGFGVRAKPVGVYQIRDGQVTWQPAMDLTRVILGGQALGAVTVLALAWALRRRRRSGAPRYRHC